MLLLNSMDHTQSHGSRKVLAKMSSSWKWQEMIEKMRIKMTEINYMYMKM